MMIRLQQQVQQQQHANEIPGSPLAQASADSEPFEADPFSHLAASSTPSATPKDNPASQNVSQDTFTVEGPTGGTGDQAVPSENGGLAFADDPFGSDPFGELMAQGPNVAAAAGPMHPSSPPQPGPPAQNDFGDDPFGALVSMSNSSVDGTCRSLACVMHSCLVALCQAHLFRF